MISQKVEEGFNAQLNAETYSAYLYWSMAGYFESMNLNGFASWMKVQAQEEMVHATMFYDQINERQGRVKLAAIDAPETEWDSPLAAFEAAYNHECLVTSRINALVDLSSAESDHASAAFLQWFVAEQVEEEASADAVVQQLKIAEGSPEALLMLDREMGTRVFTPPAAGE